ncbi:ABC transporter permease [Yangia mangrovi]|uniref:ABC transporter permease n=1 Tax=Alloyangia mangrovi TaxID=1779329 RepID=A0A2A3JZX1_9RHOB|nr:ABC transporter permease [Alloyangia mangrovi]MCA0942733.1 ABC transporter permease [Alloyangia pacifica]MCA0946262.1 ABC transporter permease [Alloyangia pacifica]MCT4368901.1 ABC transporter permease [Alloyangia mangrovi]
MHSSATPYLKALGTRLLAGIPVLLLVTFAATALSDLMAGSAAQAILGEFATPEQIAQLNAAYGYDLPAWQRYLRWLGNALQGDLGHTLYSQQPVAQVLFDRALVTFEIAFAAMIFSLAVAVPLALAMAARAGGRLDSALRFAASAMLAVPTFVSVVVLSLLFSIFLRWLPATGWVPFFDDPLGNLRHLILPVMCLSVHQVAYFFRVARNEFLATLQQDFIASARAKGFSTRYILWHHVLRPSLPQVLTVMGLSMTYLLGGSFIVESFFAIPGIGWTVLSAVQDHDLAMVQAILVLTVLIFVLVFALVDLGYALIDPRVEVK